MLESLNTMPFDTEIDKLEYKEKRDQMSEELGVLQRRVKDLNIPVMIVVEGWGAAGKGTLINQLVLPLDPRSFTVYNTIRVNHDSANRPLWWRYWNKTPENGRMILLDQSYYRDIVEEWVKNKDNFERMLWEANDFERTLADSGTVILKFFVQISQKEQKRRLKKLEKNKSTSWRVTKKDWKENKQYDVLLETISKVVEVTDTSSGSWTVLDGQNKRHATLKLYSTIIERLRSAIDKAASSPTMELKPLISAETDPYRTKILENISMDKTIDDATYKKRLKNCQKRLRDLEYRIYRERVPVVLCFEGWDAGGKGGAIKRLCENLDPRGYQVHPTAAPSAEARNHNWLWRFWNTIPKRGHVGIYDRTWYGRVMVEPIEGFLTADEFARAYREINIFEKQLTDFGTVVVKFWMNISKEEQERRFNERSEDPYKQWKITDEDWRNREKWDTYLVAVDHMIEKTSTDNAPWIIIEGNDKRYARIRVLEAVIDAIDAKI